MLVVSRKAGQSILIGPDVIVTIEDIRPGQVKVSVTAPRDVPVDRAEVRERNRRPPQSQPETTS